MSLSIIEQKLVNFNGAEIMGVKTNDGKTRIGVRWICEGIGLTDGQSRRQVENLSTDVVLSQGSANLRLPTNGGIQEVLTIELDFLPLWLAKISITPAMQRESPKVTKELIQYQLKAKDVLAAAFTHQVQEKTQAELLVMMAQENVNNEKRLTAVEENQDNMVKILTLSRNDWRNKVNRIINAIAMKQGGGDYYSEIRKESYEMLEEQGNCILNRRLDNRKARMALAGSSKSAINKISALDVIEEDKKLISVYIAVIKELAVKYQLNITRYNLLDETREIINA